MIPIYITIFISCILLLVLGKSDGSNHFDED